MVENKETINKDNTTTIQELKNEIIQFSDDRNWGQFHNPKDLAITLSLEAAELLEVFQWSGAELNITSLESHCFNSSELPFVLILESHSYHNI